MRIFDEAPDLEIALQDFDLGAGLKRFEDVKKALAEANLTLLGGGSISENRQMLTSPLTVYDHLQRLLNAGHIIKRKDTSSDTWLDITDSIETTTALNMAYKIVSENPDYHRLKRGKMNIDNLFIRGNDIFYRYLFYAIDRAVDVTLKNSCNAIDIECEKQEGRARISIIDYGTPITSGDKELLESSDHAKPESLRFALLNEIGKKVGITKYDLTPRENGSTFNFYANIKQ